MLSESFTEAQLDKLARAKLSFPGIRSTNVQNEDIRRMLMSKSHADSMEIRSFGSELRRINIGEVAIGDNQISFSPVSCDPDRAPLSPMDGGRAAPRH